MPLLIADHHLKNFDDWFAILSSNPPPPIGSWSVHRGSDDPNRVYVIGDIADGDVDAVKEWMNSESMQAAFAGVNGMSETPIEFVWANEVIPG